MCSNMITNSDLTIVIPAYNAEQYVDGAMACAAACRPSIILFGDDYSADDTLGAAQVWQERLGKRLRIVHNPENLGMTRNWQRLFCEVDTPFCLKLDVDDLVLSAYVADALELLRQWPDISVVAADAREVLVNDNDQADAALAGLAWQAPAPQIMAGTAAAAFVTRWQPYPCSATTIYRMTAWREVGGYAEEIGACSDQEIWFRLAKRGRVAFYPEAGAVYRVLPTSITRRWMAADLTAQDLGRAYRSGRRVWPEAELQSLFRRQFLRIAKANLGSAIRSGWRHPARGLANLGDCVRHLLWAAR